MRKKIKLANDREATAKSLDALWRLLVKERAGWRCEYCGQTGKVFNSHHIFSRKHLATRWDVRNGICLCSGHHRFIAHGEPETFRRFLVEKIGQPLYDLLYSSSHTPVKLSAGELAILEIDLKRQLHKIKEVMK